MPVLLGYSTAFQVIRTLGGPIPPSQIVLVPLSQLTYREEDLKHARCPWTDYLSQPFHIMVSPQTKHYQTNTRVLHTSSPFDEGIPAFRLDENLYCVTPEVLFAHMACLLNRIALAMVGFELCGTYRIDGDSLKQRSPVANTSMLGEFLYAHNTLRGSQKALSVLSRIIDGSASPMETACALGLSLPRSLGGCGLPKPLLNYEISLSEHAEKILGYPTITPDLYWPEGDIAIEYDSNLHHTGAHRIAQDARRRNSMEMDNHQVVTVTNQQLAYAQGLDGIAHIIAKALNKRIRFSSENSWREHVKVVPQLYNMAIHHELLLGATDKQR